MPPYIEQPNAIRRHADRLIEGGGLAIEPSDGELLMRFVRHRDQSAFAELVAKHANLVWNVCWQILRRHHDVEDAFQATFLILARRASSIRTSETLAGWLYRVAYRTALRSRIRAREKQTSELYDEHATEGPNHLERLQEDEHRSVLLEELQSLPRRYQEPLVLCYLAGNPRCRVADELSLTTQTVKGRLARGKQLLRQRLIRRGVSLSIAMGIVHASSRSAQAAFARQATSLIDFSNPQLSSSVGGNNSSHAMQLADQGIRAMQILTATKYSLFTALAVGTMTVGLTVTAVEQGDSSLSADGQSIVLADSAQPHSDEGVATEDQATVTLDAPVEVTLSADALDGGAEVRADRIVVQTPPAIDGKVIRVRPPVLREIPVPPKVIRARAGNMNFTVADLSPDIVEAHAELMAQQVAITELEIQAKRAEIAAMESSQQEERKVLETEAKKLLKAAELAKLEAQRAKHQAELEHVRAQKKALPEANDLLREQLQSLQAALAEVRATEQKLREELDLLRQQLRREAKTLVPAEREAKPAEMPTSNVLVPGASTAVKRRTSPLADQTRYPPIPPETQKSELQPGDPVLVEVIGTLPDAPIKGTYVVEPMGTLALGAAYGRVQVGGMDLLNAEEAVQRHLSEILEQPKVQITRFLEY